MVLLFLSTFAFWGGVREVSIDKAKLTSAIRVSGSAACVQETQRWYQSGAGVNAAHGVQAAVTEMSSEVFGYYALQLGDLAQRYQLLEDSRIGNCFTVAPTRASARDADLIADVSALPVEFDNIDLVVASHVLDCTSSPHQILREIERVLVPEGHCILIGYNPVSWRGLRLLWKRIRKQDGVPTVYTAFRLKDWFTVLGFEVLETRTVGFRKRRGENKWLQRFGFLQTLFTHYRRLFGNVRLIHVRKKVSKMTPIKRRLRAKPLLKPGMAVNSGSVGKSINKTMQQMEQDSSK